MAAFAGDQKRLYPLDFERLLRRGPGLWKHSVCSAQALNCVHICIGRYESVLSISACVPVYVYVCVCIYMYTSCTYTHVQRVCAPLDIQSAGLPRKPLSA